MAVKKVFDKSDNVEKLSKVWDCIVIGLGPAGCTAGIYAARYNMSVLLVGDLFGSLISEISQIENYPGFEKISGVELVKKMEKQYLELGGFIYRNSITKVENFGKTFVLTVDGGKKFQSKSVIVTTGTKRKKLNIEGEDKFRGRGVSYCAVCDAPFFKNKKVAVVGGGDSAFSAVLHLSQFASKVYLIHRKNEFRAQPFLVDSVKRLKTVELILNTTVTKINGGMKVTNVILRNVNIDKEKTLLVDGVFIETGNVPTLALIDCLKVAVDKKGYIKVNGDMSTNVKGLFAAGDCTNGLNGIKQIITASAMGAIAAESAYKHIHK